MKKRKMFHFGFLKNYLCFAVVVMILLVPIYWEAYHLLEQEAQENLYRSMEHGLEILTDEIESIHSTIIRFPSNQYYTYVRSLKTPIQSSDYYALHSIKNYLADITSALSFPSQTMVWFSNGIIVTPETVYSRPEQSDYRLFHTGNQENIGEWCASLSNREYKNQFLEAEFFSDWKNGEYIGLPMIHTYASAGNKEMAFYVSVFDIETIYNLLGLQELRDIAHIAISDIKTQEKIFDNGIAPGEQVILLEVKNSMTSLSFQVEVPKKFFADQWKGMWQIAIVYLILFVLVAVVMAILLARWTARPVRKLVTTLNRYTKETDQKELGGYKDIERSIENIGDKSLALLDAQAKLHGELYRWLLREQIVNGLEGKGIEEAVKLNRDFQRPFRMAILQVNNQQVKTEADEIMKLLEAVGLSPIFFCKAKTDLFLILLEEEDREDLRTKLNLLIQKKEEEYQCECIISVSRLMISLDHIHEWYQAGRYSMKYLSVQRLIFQDELDSQIDGQYAELNLIENVKLTDQILAGCKEEAGHMISRQWYQVSISREYSMMEQLYYMQAAVLNHLADKLNYEMRVDMLGYNDVIPDVEQKMLEFAENLCDLAIRKKQDKKNELPRTIAEYIDCHYTDPDFYMGTLVEVFDLSDKTIGKLIKNYCNCGFSKYLENLRIKKARTLLENPKLSIETIACQSGFGSENTFYKVFKKIYNVSPSTYRANLKCLNENNLAEDEGMV